MWYRTCRSVADEQKVNQAIFEQTKQHNEEDSLVARPVKTRRSLTNSNGPTTRDGTSSSADFSQTDPCFISNEQGECRWGVSHRATSLGIHDEVLSCNQALQDRVLLSKLLAGDMVAITVVCHLSCLNQLYKMLHPMCICKKMHDQEMGILKQQAPSELRDFAETF